MPIKRQQKKRQRTIISDAARAIWVKRCDEKIALFDDGSDLIVNKKLAEALGVEPFVVMLNLHALVDELDAYIPPRKNPDTGPDRI
tara:strand:- start:160 stop:417 length:258 start_codon:yes stop_codon:yes gene_type:complete